MSRGLGDVYKRQNINTQEGNDGIQFHITARLKCLRDSGLLEKECKKVKKTY